MIEGSLLRVLITRLSAVGDCVHTLPLASAIRARYPRAMIAWCVEPAAAPLVEAHPAVNRVVVVPKGWLKSPATILRVRNELRRLECDTVIDPQSLSKSSLAGWLSGAKRRIGFAPPQGREVAPWLHNMSIESRATHVVDRYMELLEPLDLHGAPVNFRLRANEEAETRIAAFVRNHGLEQGFVVINPGAAWDSKLWPTDRYGCVARHIGQAARLRSVISWAGTREKAWAEKIVAESAGNAVLAPQTTLLELTALLSRATAYVGSDTGPTHMAAALGVPCIAMYGPTRGEECGPYGSGHVTLQKQYHDGTARERRSADNAAMCAIGVEDVCQACEQALERCLSTPVRQAA